MRRQPTVPIRKQSQQSKPSAAATAESPPTDTFDEAQLELSQRAASIMQRLSANFPAQDIKMSPLTAKEKQLKAQRKTERDKPLPVFERLRIRLPDKWYPKNFDEGDARGRSEIVSSPVFLVYCMFTQQHAATWNVIFNKVESWQLPKPEDIRLSPDMKDLVIVKMHPNLMLYANYWCILTLIAGKKFLNLMRQHLLTLPYFLTAVACSEQSPMTYLDMPVQTATLTYTKAAHRGFIDGRVMNQILEIWAREFLECFVNFQQILLFVAAVSTAKPDAVIFNRNLASLRDYMQLEPTDNDDILRQKLRNWTMHTQHSYNTAQVGVQLYQSMTESTTCIDNALQRTATSTRTLQQLTWPLIPEEISKMLDEMPDEERTKICLPDHFEKESFDLAFLQLPRTAEACMNFADALTLARESKIWDGRPKFMEKLMFAYTSLFSDVSGNPVEQTMKMVNRIASFQTADELVEYTGTNAFPELISANKDNEDDMGFEEEVDGLTSHWFRQNYKPHAQQTDANATSTPGERSSLLEIDTPPPVNGWSRPASRTRMSTPAPTRAQAAAGANAVDEPNEAVDYTPAKLFPTSARVHGGSKELSSSKPGLISINSPSQIEVDANHPVNRSLASAIEEESEDERDSVHTWSIDHDRDVVLKSENAELETLRQEYGISNLDVVRERQLLYLVRGDDPTDVPVGEAKLVAGDGPIANYVNQSLAAQLATAVAAFLPVEVIDDSANDPNADDEQMRTMLHFVHNRMQCAENSDRAAWFGANAAVFDHVAGAKAILMSLLGPKNAGLIIHRVYQTPISREDPEDWYSGYTDEALMTELQPRSEESKARFCLLEFKTHDRYPNLKPNLEDMREVKRNICAWNSTMKRSFYPLCYIYTLLPRRNRRRRDKRPSSKYGYRVISSWHQLREQLFTRVHFMLVALDYIPAEDNGGRTLNLMPSRVCPVCGLCQSAIRMTKETFERHMYIPEYNCVMGRYFSNPISPNARLSMFYEARIQIIEVNARVDAIMNEFSKTHAFAAIATLIRRKEEDRERIGKLDMQVALRDALDLMEDTLRAPLVEGMNPFLHTIVTAGRLYRGVSNVKLHEWVDKISLPMTRVLGLLRLDDETFKLKCVPKPIAALLTKKQIASIVSSAQFGRAALFLEACRFSIKALLMNLPLDCFQTNASEEPDAPINFSVSDMVMTMAAQRPDKQTVDFCQDNARSATDARTPDRSTGMYDAYKRLPPTVADNAADDDAKSEVNAGKEPSQENSRLFGSQSSENNPNWLLPERSIGAERHAEFIALMNPNIKIAPLTTAEKLSAQAEMMSLMFDAELPAIDNTDNILNTRKELKRLSDPQSQSVYDQVSTIYTNRNVQSHFESAAAFGMDN